MSAIVALIMAAIIVAGVTGLAMWVIARLVDQLNAVRQEASSERASLLAQIQANAQSMPYYPQIGPFDTTPLPEPKMWDDGMGFLAVPEEDAMEEVADR